jgi:hypothetical protein
MGLGLMDLADLRADVRDLIGFGAFDRLFSPSMANEAVNFACSQVAEILGITRTDVLLAVASNTSVIPNDCTRIISVQSIAAPTGPFAATWTVPAQEGFLTLPLQWEVDVLPLGGPTPVTYAWTMIPTNGGSVSFSPSNAQSASITAISLSSGEYLDVSCVVTVPGQDPQTLSQSVQYVEA